ncbi:DUF881 domain-containing protein [Frankia sp. BMG5.23]|uniref:DUF881 domain-containing protein n=1 Tax=Frankia sp. BMG5.23 TaxID=683305 RepID=UPI000461DC12|nr:DUF881 domain-containing protein [Frankia sp. BMG5.23]KDA44074.1 hypothetical protein BMG523Draft_01170 [Frankia sp. BMG5.23]
MAVTSTGDPSESGPGRKSASDPKPDPVPVSDAPVSDAPVSDAPSDPPTSPVVVPVASEPTPSPVPGHVRPGRARTRRALSLVLLAGLGFAAVAATRSAQPSFGLATARPDELAATLGAIGAVDRSLAAREQQLRREAEPMMPPVPTSVPAPAAGPDEVRREADRLAILTGMVPVTGSGLELTIQDPHRAVDASILVDALQELRDAGAEAIEIAGVRAVVSTYVADEPGRGLVVDGTSIAPPYVLRVVGDAHTLDQAMRIPGGVLDTVAARDGAQATVRTSEHIEIRALRPAPSPRYARPAG